MLGTALASVGGIVMIPLMVMSMLSVVFILERLIFWWKISRRQEKVVRQALALYPKNVEEALRLLHRSKEFPIARIFLSAILLDRPTPEEFRLALESSAQAELPLLKRFGTLFETVISVSPLLGLLGTVLGLIRAFGSLRIGDASGAQATVVTTGISEALISTAAGLTVAIVTLLFANFFRSLYRRQMALIQEYGGQLELIYRHYYERRGLQ